MSPEERELLNRSVRLGEENNKILRSMRRSQRWANVMNALYWVVIIGAAIGGYVLIQPYIEQVKGVYNGAKSELNNVSNMIQNLKR